MYINFSSNKQIMKICCITKKFLGIIIMKNNRREKYTKKFLNESLLKSLAEKPISRITVKEICEEEDVNRSTYYVYFTDPFDQLRKLEIEIIMDMAVYIDNITPKNLHNMTKQKQTLKNILEYILQKKRVFQILLPRSYEV